MADLGNAVQKAFYLGVGIASYANQKAKETLQELTNQANKLAEEMIERGEMTTEEARKFVDDMVKQAQQKTVEQGQDDQKEKSPRRIEILDEEEPNQQSQNVDSLREQVKSLQEELRRLKQD
jgi:polyhydroxyalkanoate synthesis regulator phasin